MNDGESRRDSPYAPPVLESGQRLGDYEIAARLTAGGMATLFIARRPGDAGPPVAIKLIHEHLSQDWEMMRMFIDEALISIRIRHPNVVRVDELGELEGRYYLVMEYVHGCSLAELMAVLDRRGRRLDPKLASWIASRVAHGLHAAHELRSEEGEILGVIHRDVSPQNVLLSHHGEVKLTDFGIAKARGRAERSKQGEVRGKFRYMAPEQVLGGSQDRRVDVYALGVVLWEMLTQRRLYDKVPMNELIARVKDPKIEAPSTHRGDVPKDFDDIVLAALKPDASSRPANTRAWGETLDAVSPLPDGQARLSELVREMLGPQLMEAASGLPNDVRQALALDDLEPTMPRGDASVRSVRDPSIRDESNRKEPSLRADGQRSLRATSTEERRSRIEARAAASEGGSGGAALLGLFFGLLALVGAAAAALWLLD